jgi:hypothetical protein
MWHDIKRLSYLSSSSSTYRQGEQAASNITHMTKPYMVSCSYTSNLAAITQQLSPCSSWVVVLAKKMVLLSSWLDYLYK